MLKNELDLDLRDQIECPRCGAPVGATLRDVAAQKMVRCTRGHSVKLVDDGHVTREVMRVLDELEQPTQFDRS